MARRTVQTTVAVAVLLAAGSLFAACGGDPHAEYQRQLLEVGSVVEDALAKLPDGQTDTSEVDAADVRRLDARLREAADQLDDLDPPDDATRPQAQLERGLRGVASAFAQLAKDLDAAHSDEDRAQVFVAFATDPDIDRAFERLGDAQDAYAAAKYRVFRDDAASRDTGEPAVTDPAETKTASTSSTTSSGR